MVDREGIDVLYRSLDSLFRMVEHIEAMRSSIERMERLMLILVLLLVACILAGLIGSVFIGLNRLCRNHNKGPTFYAGGGGNSIPVSARSPSWRRGEKGELKNSGQSPVGVKVKQPFGGPLNEARL